MQLISAFYVRRCWKPRIVEYGVINPGKQQQTQFAGVSGCPEATGSLADTVHSSAFHPCGTKGYCNACWFCWASLPLSPPSYRDEVSVTGSVFFHSIICMSFSWTSLNSATAIFGFRQKHDLIINSILVHQVQVQCSCVIHQRLGFTCWFCVSLGFINGLWARRLTSWRWLHVALEQNVVLMAALRWCLMFFTGLFCCHMFWQAV